MEVTCGGPCLLIRPRSTKCGSHFAAVSDPDEDWNFNFIIATRMYGHASKENIIVPKGSPLVYRQQSAIIRGAQGDNLYAFMRVNAGSSPVWLLLMTSMSPSMHHRVLCQQRNPTSVAAFKRYPPKPKHIEQYLWIKEVSRYVLSCA